MFKLRDPSDGELRDCGVMTMESKGTTRLVFYSLDEHKLWLEVFCDEDSLDRIRDSLHTSKKILKQMEVDRLDEEPLC